VNEDEREIDLNINKTNNEIYRIRLRHKLRQYKHYQVRIHKTYQLLQMHDELIRMLLRQ
jgi:hypothetical protein